MEALLEDPMQLEVWANAHQPDEKLIYKDGYWDQIIFVRDTIAGLLAATYEEYKAVQAHGITVISSHTSKSVCLPVFKYQACGWYRVHVAVQLPRLEGVG